MATKVSLTLTVIGGLFAVFILVIIVLIIRRRCIVKSHRSSSYEKIVADHKTNVRVEIGNMNDGITAYVLYYLYIIFFMSKILGRVVNMS
ncbi:hypothetical protein ACF0H5_000670 [Mactra antiquata]